MTDAEYEAKLMELLEGVNQGWGRGGVAEFLIAKEIKNGDLAAWLRRFGVRSLEGAQGSTASTDAVVSLQELARRLELLGRVAGGELGEVAGNVGREILVEFPLVLGEGGEDVDGEAEAWKKRGDEKLDLGDFEGAIASYDKALEIKLDYNAAWNNRGNALNNLGRLEEAIASYDKVLEIKPNDHVVWRNRGIALGNLGRVEESITSYDKALEFKPDDHEAWYNRGIDLGNLGRFEDAIASYDKALEFKSDFHEAWYNRGIALHNLGRLEEAITSCDKVLEFKPDYHEAWYNRGIALSSLGRLEEAITSYDKVLEFKPDYHELWDNRGIILCNNLKKYEEAIASHDKALEIKPDDHVAWFGRGNALVNLGRIEEAIASYDKALEFKPDFHVSWNNRGIALGNLGRVEESITSYDKALEFKPDDHEAWFSRGIALGNLGRFEDAIASYDKGLEFKPDDEAAWYNRGIALRNLGRFEDAIASFDKALKIKPDLHEPWYARGIILSNLGRIEESIASYDKALEFKPDKHEAWSNRGSALGNLGRHEDAITSFDKALEIKPDLHEAWLNRGNAVSNTSKHNQLVYELLQAKFPKSPPVTRTLLTHKLTQRGYEGEVLTLQAGLEYCQQNTHPEGYGELHQALGNAHYSRGKLNSSYTYWNKAANSYNEALTTLTKDAFLKLHLEVLQKLIRTLVNRKETKQANKLRRDATDLLQRLLTQQNYSQLTQQQLTDKLVSFEQLTVNIFIQSGQFTEALITAETDKNVCLSWLLDALPIPDYQTEETVTHAQIQQLLNPTTAAIYWHLSDASLTTFIIKSDGLLSPETCFSDSPDELEKWVKEWNQQYTDYQSKEKTSQVNHPWRAGMPSKFAQLNAILKIDVIEQQLEGITELILIPHRDLHRFPIHALFSRDFVVSYLPSAAVGISLQHRFTGISRLSPSLDPPKSPLRRGTLSAPISSPQTETLNAPISPAQTETLNTLVPPFLRGARGDRSLENQPEISPLPPNLDLPKSSTTSWAPTPPNPPLAKGGAKENTPVSPSKTETLNTLVPSFLRGVRGDQSLENPPEISHLPPNLDPPKSSTTSWAPTPPNPPLAKGGAKENTSVSPSQTETLNTLVPPLARGVRGVLSILSIENPHSVITDKNGQPKRLAPLPAAEIESEIICRMFDNSTRLEEDAATLEEVERLLQQPHNIFHFTGHGSYNFDTPLESTLYLSNTHRLTVREIIKHNLSNYELICLPACETALTDKQTILAEYVGLTSGFMRAGVGCVVSTLWPIESGASTLLMIYFYQRWREAGDSLPVALANAQKWLREATREDLAAWYQGEIDKISENSAELSEVEFMLSRFFNRNRQALATMELDPPYQHPYYWAAFTITGL
ncbi:tetratricopeptide repeat protein [Microcoleus sp. bin48.metabat.b7b8b9.023]|uniref:tetratricopeptide repeat protein n=1 Tax=unclassified Microcoleus TaxID=2642155 RepID=UPI003451FE18